MEKFYSSKALLKMAGGGMHPPIPHILLPPLEPTLIGTLKSCLFTLIYEGSAKTNCRIFRERAKNKCNRSHLSVSVHRGINVSKQKIGMGE